VLNAFWAALLVSVAAGIVGSYIVARRLVFFSGGITHASFGGIGIAYYLGLNPIFGATVFAVITAFGVEALSNKFRVREDSAIGILWSVGMAIGVFFVFLTPGYAPNLMSFLFGSILTVSKQDIYLLLGLDIVMISFFTIFFRPILYLAFDPNFARTQKVPEKLFTYILKAFLAMTIVLSIRLVGIILLISLLTIPPTIANLFTKKFKNIIYTSIIVGFIGSLVGLLISYGLNVPSGATIILSLVFIFLVARFFRFIKEKINNNQYKL
jgi:zinc transport system permease protein